MEVSWVIGVPPVIIHFPWRIRMNAMIMVCHLPKYTPILLPYIAYIRIIWVCWHFPVHKNHPAIGDHKFHGQRLGKCQFCSCQQMRGWSTAEVSAVTQTCGLSRAQPNLKDSACQNYIEDKTHCLPLTKEPTATERTAVQNSRFKLLRQFQLVFLFTWQSATYQIIKKSSQHENFETWPSSRQARTTATAVTHTAQANLWKTKRTFCHWQKNQLQRNGLLSKTQDSNCSDDFNLCFSSPGNQQLTRSSRNHHSTRTLKHDLPPDRPGQQQQQSRTQLKRIYGRQNALSAIDERTNCNGTDCCPKFKIQTAQTISTCVSLHLAISNLPDHQEIITARELWNMTFLQTGQDNSNSSHAHSSSESMEDKTHFLPLAKEPTATERTAVQNSRFKLLRRFQLVFLFTWQSATYQIIKKSSQHENFETWPSSRQARTTATAVTHTAQANLWKTKRTFCHWQKNQLQRNGLLSKTQDSNCSDDFNLCFSSPGNQQLTRSSRNHHRTWSNVDPVPGADAARFSGGGSWVMGDWAVESLLLWAKIYPRCSMYGIFTYMNGSFLG